MKGVFCLEGFWFGDHREKMSVVPVLDLIHRYNKMPFIHHRCATIEEFQFSITRWKNKSFHKRYPLLYLAFHGHPGVVMVGKTRVTLDHLAGLLEDKCEGVVIHFGCCSTLDIDRRLLQSFMEKTRSVAVMGYREEVGWLPSASFEIQLLDSLSNQPFDTKGVEEIRKEVMEEYGNQARKLDFRFVPNERIHFPRKRK